MVNVTDLLELKFGTPMEPSSMNQGSAVADSVDQVRVSGEGKELIVDIAPERNDEREAGQVSNPNGVEGNHDGFELSLSNKESLDGLSVIRSAEGVLMRDEEETVSQSQGSVQIGNEFNGINLVVDLSQRGGSDRKFNLGNGFSENGTGSKVCSTGIDFPVSDGIRSNGEQNAVINEHAKNDGDWKRCDEVKEKECRTDKEGEYEVSDLVWGKVRSHPWWPGQIFDPSAASEKAKKHCKKNGFLIAYFGDQTFAWNDVSQIKPFRKHFSRMEKQSNTEAFCHALDCALDEFSRRIEFGLACSCMEEKVYAQIKSQVVINTGISEESSKRVGGDSFSTDGSFVPAKLVQCVKALALSLFAGTDRLEFVKARAQLRAYNRWKGYYQLSTETLHDGLLESNAAEPVEWKDGVTEDADAASEGDENDTSGKGKSIARGNALGKRKHISVDSVRQSKKEKCLSDLTSRDCLNLPVGKNKSVKDGTRTRSSFCGRKRKVIESLSDQRREENTKKTYRVGEGIRRIAHRLSVASPTFKNGDKCSQEPVNENDGKLSRASHAVPLSGSKKSEALKVPEAYPPSDESLSQLCLLAIDPMKENSYLTSVLHFFIDFRSYCLKNTDKYSAEKVYVEGTVKSSPNSETVEASRPIGFEDSYWTDMIVQGNSENQVLFEPEVSTIDYSPKSEDEHGTGVAGLKSDAGKLAGHLDDNCNEYSGTALVLNFDKKASVPSVTNLNNIYSQYGPLKEVSSKNKRAKIVFERRSDAETAFSSSGKYSTFGPSLLTYSLDYSPTPGKRITPARKQTE